MTHPFTDESPSYDRSRLWLPPGRRPARGQAIGSPYVWDGQARPPNGAAPPAPGRHSKPGPDSHPWGARATERSVIGDQLREIVAWCELSPCITRYTDAAALGQADIVARAIDLGWRKDAIGRLICPACQQRHPIWSAAPLVPRINHRRPY